MKIFAYEVRRDEELDFDVFSKNNHVKITKSNHVPCLENALDLEGYEAVSVSGMGKIDRDLLKKYSELGIKYLCTRTIGYNHIDIKAASEFGIKVCNTSYSPDGVADFTVMLMLMCLRQYKQAMWRGQVNDFSLNGLQGRDMSKMTVGIIGTGSIGNRVLKTLSGFGCRLLCYNRSKNDEALKYAQYVDLDTLYAESDIISLHVPLTKTTHHMINRDSIAKMKDQVIIINCARGELTDTDSLVEGIENEKIGALGMDCTEGEENFVHADHRTDILKNRNWFYLHQFRNVIMTQHMAFYTKDAVSEMVNNALDGLLQMKKTGTCKTILN